MISGGQEPTITTITTITIKSISARDVPALVTLRRYDDRPPSQAGAQWRGTEITTPLQGPDTDCLGLELTALRKGTHRSNKNLKGKSSC